MYELRPSDAPPLTGSIALAPNELRVLEYVCVYSRIVDFGFSYSDLTFLNGKRELLGKMWNGNEREYNFDALRVRRYIVREALIDKCEERGVRIRYSMNCLGVDDETKDGATV